MTNRNGKLKALAKDTGLFAISTFGSKILVFLLTPLYTSILVTEEFGIADLITSIVNLTYPILTLAISESTLRFAIEKNENKNKVLINSIWFVIISTLFLLALTPFSKNIYREVSDYWLIFVGVYLSYNVHLVLSNFIKGLGKTKLFAIQALVQTLSIVVCNVLFLAIFKWGLKGYILSIYAGFIIPGIIIFIFGRIYRYIFPLSIDSGLLKKMLRYCIPMIPTLMAWAINSNIDKFMIIGFLGLGESGIYSVAHRIPTLLITVLSVFSQAWQLSAINNYGDYDESDYYTSVYRALDIVSVLGCFIIILLTKFLSALLFAKDYYVAWQFVSFLTISSLYSSNSGFISAAFKAAKKTNNLFYTVIAGSLVNVILNFVLIQRIGTIGAAISTMVGFFVVWLFRISMVQKIVKIKINLIQTIISYVALTAAAAFFSFNVPHSYAIVSILFILTMVVNKREIIHILSFTGRAIKYLKTRR